MKTLHCEVLYDSLKSSKDKLNGNDIAITRTDRHITFVMTDGTPQSATYLSSKIRHLLSYQPTSLKSWESFIMQFVNWGNEWKHLISLINYNYNTNQTALLEFQGEHICFHRQYHLLPIKRQIVGHHETFINLSLVDIFPDDLISIFRSSALCNDIGYHLTCGWMHDFGPNSEMMKKDRQPCSRMLMNDIMIRIQQHHNKEESTLIGLVHLRPTKQAVIMLGPPSDPELDHLVVNKLVHDPQAIKIVCGGTTSEIVSRCLDRRLVTIPTSSTNIPPLSMIDGIDLVTEGVLTLRKTIEILEVLNTMQSLVLTFHDLHQYDGAFHLTRLLCSTSTHIHFLIGLARNDDHDYRQDICFETKAKLGQQLIALLVQMGKHVTVEYN